MQETTIIGYRVKDNDGAFMFVRSDGMLCTMLQEDEVNPSTLSEAYRVISMYIDQNPDEPIPEIVKVESTRQLSPLETTSRSLGDLLLAQCKLHGLDLGLTREQVTKRFAKELAHLGSTLPHE